jgi:hypothetical protein
MWEEIERLHSFQFESHIGGQLPCRAKGLGAPYPYPYPYPYYYKGKGKGKGKGTVFDPAIETASSITAPWGG